MQILIRLNGDTGDPSPLRIRLTRDATVGDLADHLAGWVGVAPGCTIEGLRREDLVREVGPCSGSVVRLESGTGDVPRDQTAPVRLLSTVTEGRASSEEVILRYGSNDLGTVELMISNEIEIVPRPDTWVFLNGHRAIGSRRVVDGDLVSIVRTEGGPDDRPPDLQKVTTAFAVEVSRALDPPEHGPFRSHRPLSRIHDEFAPTTITVQSPPEANRLPGLPILSALVPLLFGAVLWATTRSMASAVFVLFSFLYIAVAGVESHLEFRRDLRYRESEFRKAARRTFGRLADANEHEAAFLDRTNPDITEIEEMLESGSPRIWERCPDDTTGGFLSVRLGMALRRGATRVEGPMSGRSDLVEWFDRELEATVHTDLPVTIDLSHGGGLGLVGGDESASDLARWVVLQLTTLIGPDLLRVVVLTSQHRAEAWRWTAWLPHTNAPSEAPWTVVVVDGADEVVVTRTLRGFDPLRTRCLWLTARRSDLPRSVAQSVSTGREPMVVRARGVDHDSFAVVDMQRITWDGASEDLASRMALVLTPMVPHRILGPSARDDHSTVDLSGILRTVRIDDPGSILEAWHDTRNGSRLAAPLARSGSGVVEVDLASDGPHALVAGMTGAGKSELLRTWLTTLALLHPPERVTFLLVDYKGGSAFGPLSRLPHAVGLITDLDDELAQRAMVSLRAELRARESWLAGVGAGSMVEARERPDRPPALVVVVDEFATLAKELPDMVDELVDVAQRGRSLGIHLVLATQRPHGVVSDSIRANTSIRIALRVADVSDSTDVIDAPDAVSIPRTSPGSAIVRIGQSLSGTVRFAYSSGPFHQEPRISSASLWARETPVEPIGGPDENEIDLATRSMISAFEASGAELPTRPWVAPLPAVLALDSLATIDSGHHVTIGLVDRPERQEIVPLVLDLDDGPGIVVFGTAGGDRSMCMSTIAEAAAHSCGGTSIHSIGRPIDHSTDHIDLEDAERVLRLLRRARARIRDLDRGTRMLILVDDIAVFENHYGSLNRGEAMAIIEEICRSGGRNGVNIVVGASRRMDLPATLAVGFRHRIVLHLTSDDEASMLGVPTSIADELPAGRGIHEGHWVQIGAGRDCDENCGNHFLPTPRLPDLVDLGDIVGAAPPDPQGNSCAWRIPMALDTDDLTPRVLDLSHGHAIVAGPRRSGRSTTLHTIADAWRRTRGDERSAHTILIGPSPLRPGDRTGAIWDQHLHVTSGPWDEPETSRLEAELSELLAAVAAGDQFLIGIEELPMLLEGSEADVLERFITNTLGTSAGDSIRIVAAGEIEAMSRCYSPAVNAIRAGRTGILLRPDVDVHGAILGCDLGRRDELESRPGRGWLVADGDPTPVQIASTPHAG